MDDKAASVRSTFSAIAGRYDLLNRVLSLGMDTGWRRLAVSRCTSDTGSVVLDVATGTGDMARLLAEQNSDCTVVGIDFCPDMLDIAKARITTGNNGGRIQLVQADALMLPFHDAAFDCAALGFALRNVVSIADTFREIARVLKPGGKVVSVELTRPRLPILKTLHSIYMWHFIKYVGGLISGNREAYTYLPRSIAEHIAPEEVKDLMRDAGFQEVEIHRLFYGTATVHAGKKTGS